MRQVDMRASYSQAAYPASGCVQRDPGAYLPFARFSGDRAVRRLGFDVKSSTARNYVDVLDSASGHHRLQHAFIHWNSLEKNHFVPE